MTKLWPNIKSNFKTMKFDLHEISGSLGDLGLYIPLATALVTVNGLNIVSVLFFSGLFNCISGLAFGIPICVQPMKAIATIAIADGLTSAEIGAAGIISAAVILLIGMTDLLKLALRYIPKSVVRGIQVALGLKLLLKGLNMIWETGVWLAYDSIFTGSICCGLLLVMLIQKKFPAALTLFIVGLVLAFLNAPTLLKNLEFNITWPQFVFFGKENFIIGGIKGALPQIPLTLLNSVIAVCALSRKLFPEHPLSEKEVSISVGLMNLVSCFFGAMPVCHGAGGLAGQYHFGARTGGSIVFLGSAKMILAILMGSALIPIMVSFPYSVLGALLIFVGFEMVKLIKDMKTKQEIIIVLITVGSILVLKTAVGFIIGLGVAFLFTLYTRRKNQKNSGTIS